MTHLLHTPSKPTHRLPRLLAIGALALASSAMAQVTLYEGEGFRGRAFTADQTIENLRRLGFNDLASSVMVDGGSWEVCDDAAFGGRCAVLRPGAYDTLRSLGMDNRISSVRPVPGERRYSHERLAPMAQPAYDYRRRPNEAVFEVPVQSVHAVSGAPGQRCWVEHSPAAEPNRNVGGALIGGLLGGVIGHQLGGGFGRDLATVGGTVAGAVIGSKAGGRDEREVRRCETTAAGPVQYWDVGYEFRGMAHQVQMSSAPGRSIVVNADGLPRQ